MSRLRTPRSAARGSRWLAVIAPALAVAWMSVVAVPAAAANGPPVLQPIGDRTIAEQSTLMFIALATDPDPGDHLTFSLGGDPPAGAAIDAWSGLFRWKPTEAQGPGTYTVDVIVTDDAEPPGEDSEEITVTVTEVNRAPVLGSIGNLSVLPGATITFTAGATDGDIPQQTLVFSLSGAPDNASIDASTGAFSWTPTASQVGTWTLKICVSDGVLGDCESFIVAVGVVNRPPVIDSLGISSSIDIAWGETLSFTATAHDADESASGLRFSLVGAPSGASITPRGGFTWMPSSAQIRSYTFEVRVTDNGVPPLSADARLTVAVGRRLATIDYATGGYGSPQFSDEMECYASLRDASGGSRYGSPIANASIAFALDGRTKFAATNASGTAETGFLMAEPAGMHAMVSTFAGDALYRGASDTERIKVVREHARLRYTGDRSTNVGGHTWVQLSARLDESVDGSLGGELGRQLVVFEVYRSGLFVRSCSVSVVGVSGSSGVASCDRRLAPGRYHVITRLAPNGYYEAARVRTLLVVR